MFSICGIVRPQRIGRLDERRAEVRAEDVLDLPARRPSAIGSSALTPGNVSIDSRMTPMRTPFSEPAVPGVAALAA